MSVRLLAKQDIELIASFIWHGNMSYTGGGTGQLIPYDALVQMLQRENQRNFIARYGPQRTSVLTPWAGCEPLAWNGFPLKMIDDALSAYDYNCFDQGEPDGNTSSVHNITGRARRKLDELMQEDAAHEKRRNKRARANRKVQQMAAPIVAERRAEMEAAKAGGGDVLACYQKGIEFKQGPSGNWLWRIDKQKWLSQHIIDMLRIVGSDWHRPRGALTREACAKAARAFCGL